MDVIVEAMDRFSIVELLEGSDNVGIELGVAAGGFSTRMMASGKFRKGFGVDLYGDYHDVTEYRAAITAIGLETNYSLLRMSFDEALDLFPDGYFDFIYIDGYAHTGEQGGKTFFDWLPKVKPGGIMAGDDYDDKWPLVKEAVHHFVGQLGARLHVTDASKVQSSIYDASPSWFIRNEDLNADWKRNDAREKEGISLSEETEARHRRHLELGKIFDALIKDSSAKGQPSFFDRDGKRLFVVVKDLK